MNKSLYIIGLPSSGKSTFLAALGYILINGRGQNYHYHLTKVNNMDYLNKLADKWSKCEVLDRTSQAEKENIVLSLNDSSGNFMDITMPDQSGETFRKIVSNRVISNEVYSDISECTKIMIFINPSIMSPHVLLTEIKDEYRSVDSEKIEMSQDTHYNEQVEYIELFQFLSEIKKNKIKIKLILSAWDIYQDYIKYPEELLKNKLPLLWQFLCSNKCKYEVEYWGISAQGGALDKDDDKERLKNYIDPADKIIVVAENGDISSDITGILD